MLMEKRWQLLSNKARGATEVACAVKRLDLAIAAKKTMLQNIAVHDCDQLISENRT